MRLLGSVAVIVFASIVVVVVVRWMLFVAFILFVAVAVGLADGFIDRGGTKESKGLAVDDVVAPFFVGHQIAEFTHFLYYVW